jgi:DNA mismatch endonuclease, patch repair protein
MPDKISVQERSRVMRSVKGKDTNLEIKVRSMLWRKGLRFRKNVAELMGKPDIVFPGKRLVVFLDSCFWHGCPQHLRRPSSNQEYWQKKIARNIQRDKDVTKYYLENGWTVLRIWEHELKQSFVSCLERIENKVKSIGA